VASAKKQFIKGCFRQAIAPPVTRMCWKPIFYKASRVALSFHWELYTKLCRILW